MVGIDVVSQSIEKVRSLRDYHQVPVCAMHAPCLLITQRVWGTDPWGKLERSAEMAPALDADVVVVHPPFRWQRDYATGFVEGIADLERRTGIAFAVENMYPWRATSRREMKVYQPGWDPSEESYANATIDLSHAATAQSDPIAMAERLGDRLRHIHMTDGSGSAKDEHLVPGPRQPAVRGVPRAARRPRLRRATSWSRSTPARPAPARRARPTCSRRWRSAGCTSPPSTPERHRSTWNVRGACPECDTARMTDRRAPAADAGPAPPTPAPRSSASARALFAARGFGSTSVRAVAADAGVDPALVHHYFGTKDDLFVAALQLPVDPRELLAPVLEQGRTARPNACCGCSSACGTTRRTGWPCSGCSAACSSPRASGCCARASCPSCSVPVGEALGIDHPELRMPLVASQMIGLIMLRYVLEVEPVASMSVDVVVATYAPAIQRYLSTRCPDSNSR